MLTGVFIGLGAATKLYPLFFLGPLLVLCLRERQMTAWVQTFAAALVSLVAVNLPIYLWSPGCLPVVLEVQRRAGTRLRLVLAGASQLRPHGVGAR